MHNIVNKRVKQPLFPFENLKKEYNKYNTRDVLIEYYKMNITAKYSEKLMLYSYHRKKFLDKFYNYFTRNMSKFNQ